MTPLAPWGVIRSTTFGWSRRVLGDIPPGHRGDIRIEVGFLIDSNGQMQVTARELSSDRAASAHLSLLGLGSDSE